MYGSFGRRIFPRLAFKFWGKMRGIINVAKGQEAGVWLESRNTPGIGDAEWLKGFRF